MGAVVFKPEITLLLVAAGSACATLLLVFVMALVWRRRRRRREARLAEKPPVPQVEQLFSAEGAGEGELVFQFKLNQGRQTVSVLEAGGRRFVRIEGPLSATERARMVRYLKLEGFMS